MQRLSRDKYTTVLDPTLPAGITIASGEELVVETWDAYKGVWGADQEPPEVGAATGPIAVEGAGPGDALRIDILAITPGPAAMHDVRPGRGFLGETFTERRPTVMPVRDGHAVVGDGAVGGTGAECSAEVTLRITVEPDRHLPGPRALTPQHFAVLASGEDVGQTMRQAVRHMVDFLVQERGMEPYAAYSLLSLAGDVRMSRTFRPLSPVKMLLARPVLEQIST